MIKKRMYMEHIGKPGKIQGVVVQGMPAGGKMIRQRKQTEVKLRAYAKRTDRETNVTTVVVLLFRNSEDTDRYSRLKFILAKKYRDIDVILQD